MRSVGEETSTDSIAKTTVSLDQRCRKSSLIVVSRLLFKICCCSDRRRLHCRHNKRTLHRTSNVVVALYHFFVGKCVLSKEKRNMYNLKRRFLSEKQRRSIIEIFIDSKSNRCFTFLTVFFVVIFGSCHVFGQKVNKSSFLDLFKQN